MTLTQRRIVARSTISPSLAGLGFPAGVAAQGVAAMARGGSAMSAGAGALAVPLESGRRPSAPAERPGEWLAALRADPRQAVQEDSIRCLVCGRVFRQLTNTHLRRHRVSAAEYKLRFGYNRGRPLMCRALQRLYAERAVKSGLAARIRCRPILVEPELRRRGGARAIALEEWLTRQDARRKRDARRRPSRASLQD
jgi:hypothetical protein